MKFHEAYRLALSLEAAQADFDALLARLDTAEATLRRHGAEPQAALPEALAMAREVVRDRATDLAAAVGGASLGLHATVHVPSAGLWRWLRPWVEALARHEEWTCLVTAPDEVAAHLDLAGISGCSGGSGTAGAGGVEVLTLQEWFDLEGDAALTDLTLITDAPAGDLVAQEVSARSWVTATLGTHAGADFTGVTPWRAAAIAPRPYSPPLGTVAFAEAVDALTSQRPRVLWYPTGFGADPFAGGVDSLSALEAARAHDVTMLWVRDESLIELLPARSRGYVTDLAGFAEEAGRLVTVGPADLFDAIEQADAVWTTSTGLRDLFRELGRPDVEEQGTGALATIPRTAAPEALAADPGAQLDSWTRDFVAEFLGGGGAS